MNMKKTFAGAMAGALAVSAMATSASASVPGPGEYPVDLTVDGDIYATVQFTFDGDYILTGSELELAVSADASLFNFAGTKGLTAQFVGSKGTDTQTLKYTSGWGEIDYYQDSWNFNGFKIGLNTMVDPNNNWGAKQGLYTDKYATVNEALGVKKADGTTKLPTSTTIADLNKVYFDKIVVTAKVPMSSVKNLSELNAVWGEKSKVVASMKGIDPIVIKEVENNTTAETAAVTAADKKVKALKAAKAAFVLNVATAGETAADILTAAGFTAAEIALYDDAAKFDAAIDVAADELAAAQAALTAATGSSVVVDYELDATGAVLAAKAETLFTKVESGRVGPKTGITVDNGTVKTVAADIGAFKPEALRQIRDAIADNEGVTVTFTAKNEFDDAAYRSWIKTLSGGNLNWAAADSVWGTDSTKDSYEVWGESMFTGAIVLNRDFSKQFSQSGLVDWGTNTITFDWDELTEGRFYDASVVLHSLELLSTQNVEWTLCTVTVPEQNKAEPVDPSQGNVETTVVIDPTPVDTTTAEVITAAPETTPAPETTAAPAPVTNPTTGNAPVALAVIPVALAAAAIVAKKRG